MSSLDSDHGRGEMKEEVERWWEQAQEDLETAKVNKKSERLGAAAFLHSNVWKRP